VIPVCHVRETQDARGGAATAHRSTASARRCGGVVYR
jgi:hypothetical protein